MTSSSTIGLHVADYVIFAAFLTASTGIGLFFAFRGGRQRTNSEFLMANRKLKTLPVSISILVSFISGIIFLGHPVEMYTRGTQFSMRMVGYACSSVLATAIFVPLFFRLKVISSFEYLEARYRSKTVKLIGAMTNLTCMLVQMGVVLYAPAVALQAVNGIPLWVSIVLTCCLATLYTALGGMKAVIYTDVFQALCMVVGMLVIVIQGTIKVGSVRKIWELNSRDERIEFFNMDPDPTIRTSFWSTVFGAVCVSLSVFGVGQTTVQRYCALPTLKQAKCSVHLNAVFICFIFILVTAVGLVIYAFYADIGCDPLRAKYITNANQLVPYFVSNVLNYPGLPGAYLAVLFGGALSTVSSSLNSAAAIIWQDVLKYFFEHFSETRKAIVTKIFVVLFGAVGISIAFLTRFMGSHVLQALTSVLGTFTGPTLGLFMLGVLFPFANSKGAIIGSLVATSFNVWIAVGSFVYAPHKNTLPTSIENCNTTARSYNFSTVFRNEDAFWDTNTSSGSFENDWTTSAVNNLTTITNDSNVIDSPFSYLYSISFNLYALIGLVNTLIIGVIVSLLTGGCSDRKKVDSRLMVPVFDRFCCCFPESIRRRLRCGVEYSNNDNCDDDNIQRERTVDSTINEAVPPEKSSVCCFWDTKDDCCNKENLKSAISTGFLSRKPVDPAPPIQLQYLRQIEDIDL